MEELGVIATFERMNQYTASLSRLNNQRKLDTGKPLPTGLLGGFFSSRTEPSSLFDILTGKAKTVYNNELDKAQMEMQTMQKCIGQVSASSMQRLNIIK